MKRLALRSILSSKAADGSLRVVSDLGVSAPNTKQMAGVLRALGFERSVLVVTAQVDENVKMSARNIDRVRMLPASYLNVADLLATNGLLMTVDAVRGAEALWGGERAKKRLVKAEA
jgi:large subunit ribosomal protein L4